MAREQTGIDVVDETSDLDATADDRVGLHTVHVFLQHGRRVADRAEVHPRNVLARNVHDALLELLLAGRRHSAACVLYDHDTIDVQEVHTQYESDERAVRDAPTRVTQNLRVTGFQPDHPEWVNTRVHARNHGDTSFRDTVKALQIKGIRVLTVGSEQIIEVLIHAFTVLRCETVTMRINETAARVDTINRRYAEIYGFERSSDWLMLKLQEELGELADAYLGLTGRQRDKGGRSGDARERFALELADAAGLLFALAQQEGVDLERAIDAKWLVWDRREHQRDDELTSAERAMPSETYSAGDAHRGESAE